MKTVCRSGMCVGCKLCEDICPMDAVSIEEGIAHYAACIDEGKCMGCGLCQARCPQIHVPDVKKPIEWHQGWSKHEEIRSSSASGGLAAGIMGGFLRSGGKVCTCVFKEGEFRFEFLEEPSQILLAIGSKYVKSNASGIYKELERRLKLGEEVLLIGLPCQVAAARNYLGDSLSENFYAVDLVCHGTPSLTILQLYLKEKKKDLEDLKEIAFRKKGDQSLYLDGVSAEEHYKDEYSYAFLADLTLAEGCYHCPYARLERIGDVTLADSWGSELPEEEMRKGISLVLCQTRKGEELISLADAHLEDVDLGRAVAHNKQLRYPNKVPSNRDRFLGAISNGKTFRMALWEIEPVRAFKNLVKRVIGWDEHMR